MRNRDVISALAPLQLKPVASATEKPRIHGVHAVCIKVFLERRGHVHHKFMSFARMPAPDEVSCSRC